MENETELNFNEEIEEPMAEDTTAAHEPMDALRESIRCKCREAEDACKQTMERLKNDWKATDGNPYLRSTSSCRLDIYRAEGDEEPIDSFTFEKSNGCSLRALGAATALLTVTGLALKALIKSKGI